MKTFKRALLTIIAIAVSITIQAQYVGATVTFVDVKPGKDASYLELEKVAKKFHQARVEEGIITQWHLYKKLYTGTKDPYNYILVDFNDDFKKTKNAFPQEMINELYSQEEQQDFWKKAAETRTMVKTEYFDQVTAADIAQPAKYIRVIRYYVEPAKRGEFVKLRKEMVKPLFDEVVKRGHHAGWNLWHKDPNDSNFQYVAVNAFAEYGDWKSGLPMNEIFKEVFPDKDLNEAREAVMSTRVELNSEYWELIDFTTPAASE